MKTIELMGPKALTYIDYAGWLKTDEGKNHVFKKPPKELETRATVIWGFLMEAQTHLSQPWNKHMLIRPEEPDPLDYTDIDDTGEGGMDNKGYNKALHQYEKWKPMFKGDWRIHDGGDGKEIQNKSPISGKWRFVAWEGNGRNLEELIRSCEKQGIELFYHPEHEMI